MSWLTMDDYRIVFRAELLRAIPHLLNKRAGCVVLLNLDSLVEQERLYFERGAERGNDDDIIGMNFIPRNELFSVSVHDKADAATLQVVIDLLVVNHLAKEIDLLVGVFLNGAITYFDSVLHAVAEPKMASEVKNDGSEVKDGR